MNGALGIVALFVGFAFLVYAAKGSHGTKWDGKISPGPVLSQLLLGHWPYSPALSVIGSPGQPLPSTGPGAPASFTPGSGTVSA